MLAVIVTAAFVFGFLASQLRLPPLVGFLVAGFALRLAGFETPQGLTYIGDFGVSLLLFTIGLKLKIKDLARPIVWGGGTIHLVLASLILGVFVWFLGLAGLPICRDLTFPFALVVGFALSFSSTVFAVKSLEERAELAALHGVIAVGILIMQDILAVVFLATAAGKTPSSWAVLLLLLIPLNRILIWTLKRCGHGELLILLGFILTFAAYELFDFFGVKGDLGAIAVGMLMANHPKAKELAGHLLGFKDVFLMAFFVGIGLSEPLSVAAFGVGVAVLLLLPFKVALYYLVLTRFHLQPRAAFLASAVLANYSEFGLVVASVAVKNLWLDGDWLVVIAVALSLSYIGSSALNAKAHTLYDRFRHRLDRLETSKRLTEQSRFSLEGIRAVVFGLGRVGTGAYRDLEERFGPGTVVGVDSNPALAKKLREKGYRVIVGDASDADFWERVDQADDVRIVLLAMANHYANLQVARTAKAAAGHIFIAATAHYPEDEKELRALGIGHVYNFYSGAGAGFAEHAWHEYDRARMGPGD